MYLEINVNADVSSEDSTKVGLQVLSLALFTILSMLGEVTLCRDIILILCSCVDCTFQVVQYGSVKNRNKKFTSWDYLKTTKNKNGVVFVSNRHGKINDQ